MVTFRSVICFLYKKYYVFIVLFSAFGCDKIFEDDKLSFSTNISKIINIRTDGYYYFVYPSGDDIEIIVLYKNGVLQSLGSGFKSISDPRVAESLTSLGSIESRKKSKTWWGVFKIDEMQIVYEKWAPSGHPLRVLRCEGMIKSDTTFYITKRMRSDGTQVREVNNLYTFKEFSPKPDSTNPFVN